MYVIERSDEEIDAVLNQAAEVDGQSQWPGMTYEQGVRAGIDWLIGNDDANPMED